MGKTATTRPRTGRAATPSPATARSLARIQKDIEALRRAVRDDVRALDRRVTTLEDADGLHRKALTDIGVDVKNLQAQVKAIHTEMRTLTATTRRATGAAAMDEVRAALTRIEDRLAGTAA